MKRKIIKHGPSSYIVSLPLTWIKQFNLSKGDEVSVEEVNNDVVISASHKETLETFEFSVTNTEGITPGLIHAMYNRGVEEIKIHFNRPEEFQVIVRSLEKNEIGYEIVESSRHFCTIKTITKLTNEFDLVLRRVFLVTIALAEEGIRLIKERSFDSLSIIKSLEKSNNKFTTFCRRYINKFGSENYDRVGPLYFIVEILEKIADEYRNLYDELSSIEGGKPRLNKKILEMYDKTNIILRLYYECFYKFDYQKLREMVVLRTEVLATLKGEVKNISKTEDIYLHHHAVNLVNVVTAMIEPYLILAAKESRGKESSRGLP